MDRNDSENVASSEKSTFDVDHENYVNMVKKYKKMAFSNFKQLCRHNDIYFNNLDDLIHLALGQSKKVLENEAEFFHQVLVSDLGSCVKNSKKIQLYYPEWFKLS